MPGANIPDRAAKWPDCRAAVWIICTNALECWPRYEVFLPDETFSRSRLLFWCRPRDWKYNCLLCLQVDRQPFGPIINHAVHNMQSRVDGSSPRPNFR